MASQSASARAGGDISDYVHAERGHADGHGGSCATTCIVSSLPKAKDETTRKNLPSSASFVRFDGSMTATPGSERGVHRGIADGDGGAGAA
jgi:hypothetical protein